MEKPFISYKHNMKKKRTTIARVIDIPSLSLPESSLGETGIGVGDENTGEGFSFIGDEENGGDSTGESTPDT